MKQYETLEELKRSIYLWILPLITVALILNSFLNVRSTADVIVNSALIFWFSISWILAMLNRAVRFGEYSNIVLVSVYHVYTFHDVVSNYLAKMGGSLGDFIIWMPLIFMFFFLILGTKKGLMYSIFIILITFAISLIHIREVPAESIDSLIQFIAANIVYLLVLFYAQSMFRAFTERDFFKKHAYIDSLTRIANRHQIDVWLEEQLEATEEHGKPFSIIFFDIDHFKNVNDLYGHKVGDRVLVELAATVTGNLAEGELFGRWGGEEFILIIEGQIDQASEKAEQLRRLVESHEFKGTGNLTVSFGVTEYHTGDNIDTMLNRADQGLYFSKNSGRNKVSMK